YRINVAFTRGHLVSDVVAEFLVNNRSALCRSLYIDYRGQFFIVDHYEVGGIAGSVLICCDYGGDRGTHEIDLVGSEDCMDRYFQAGQCRAARDRADFSSDIFAGIHSYYARRLRRFGGVDAFDPRMGVNRANECNMQRIGQLDIIDVVAESLN